jgi:hypothetical protein
MQSEEYVIAALRALAEQDREREAPEEVEMRALQAFRHRRARRRLKAVALAGLATAAAIILFFAISRERPKQAVPAAIKQQPVAVAAVPEPAERPAARARSVKRQPREIVTQFFPLMDAPPPFERGELLRVVVPASTMRRVGLPVNEDRLADPVYADVLVGQEGLARAIRFVSYEQ